MSNILELFCGNIVFLMFLGTCLKVKGQELSMPKVHKLQISKNRQLVSEKLSTSQRSEREGKSFKIDPSISGELMQVQKVSKPSQRRLENSKSKRLLPVFVTPKRRTVYVPVNNRRYYSRGSEYGRRDSYNGFNRNDNNYNGSSQQRNKVVTETVTTEVIYPQNNANRNIFPAPNNMVIPQNGGMIIPQNGGMVIPQNGGMVIPPQNFIRPMPNVNVPPNGGMIIPPQNAIYRPMPNVNIPQNQNMIPNENKGAPQEGGNGQAEQNEEPSQEQSNKSSPGKDLENEENPNLKPLTNKSKKND